MSENDADGLKRYLLGCAGPDEADAIERRLFSEDRLHAERLAMAEDELIDAYARGTLDAAARVAFDARFLVTGERRAKLEFARALTAYAQSQQAHPDRGWAWLTAPAAVPRWALAAAAVLVAALLPALLWFAGPAPGNRPTSVFALSPGLLRDGGGGAARVTLSRGCDVAYLDLLTGADPHPSYGATVYDIDGQPIWSQHKLAGAARDGSIAVRLTLPCAVIGDEDYWIRLVGEAPGRDPVVIDRYDFRVLRE